jgi:hypothetical protein
MQIGWDEQINALISISQSLEQLRFGAENYSVNSIRKLQRWWLTN